jgi:hypothetical protein
MRALMQLLAGLVVGLMLAGGGYAVVKIIKIQRAEKAATTADAGLAPRQQDPSSAGAGVTSTTGAGAAPTTAAPGNPGTGAVEVPNVVGINAANAMTELRKRGLNDIKLTSDTGQGIDANKSADWTVVQQSEKPGAKVGASTAITLTCIRGY